MSLLSIVKPARLPDASANLEELEPFARVRLIVLDLDGTLLADFNDLPASSQWRARSHLANRLISRGIPVTLATGRAYSGARAALEGVARHKNVPAILYNGGVVMTPSGVVLAHHPFAASVVRALVELVKCTNGACALFYWIRSDLAGQLEPEWAVFLGEGVAPEREFNGILVCAAESVPIDANCVAVLLWAEDASTKARLFEAACEIPGASCTSSGSRYIEVRPAGSSKAVGLRVLLDCLRVSADHVMAIGDNDNDVEMLSAVGLSVCVENASVNAQSVSRFKTTYPSTAGVIEALELVTRARRLWTGIAKINAHK